MSETDPSNEPVSPDESDGAVASDEAAARQQADETAEAGGAPEAAAAPSDEIAPEIEAAADAVIEQSEEPGSEASGAEAPEPEDAVIEEASAVVEAAEPEMQAAETETEIAAEAADEAAAGATAAESRSEAPAPEIQPAPVGPPAAEEAPVAAAPVGEPSAGTIGVPGMDWYIIHSYSGFENKVRESLRTRADAFGFGERIGEILIPTEDVVEMRNGKKVTSKRLLYPGYVLVQLKLDDELWHVVKNTPRVTGFVGGGQSPAPLSADEVNQILYRQSSSEERPRPKLSFDKNDRVKIIDGPFTNFTGAIEDVNTDRNTLKVMVTIFGRATPVELEYFQVEKEQV